MSTPKNKFETLANQNLKHDLNIEAQYLPLLGPDACPTYF